MFIKVTQHFLDTKIYTITCEKVLDFREMYDIIQMSTEKVRKGGGSMKIAEVFCTIENKDVCLQFNQEILRNGNGRDVMITSIFCNRHCRYQGTCYLTQTIRS